MYSCEECDFHSSNKNDYRRHLLTRKHETVRDGTTENTKHLYTCICGKSYRFSQGLSRHKRTCKRVIQDIHDGDHLDLKGMFLEAMQQNKELQNALITKQEQILTQQQQMSNQQQQIIELIPKVGNIANNTTSNNQFNLNYFLNEQCKDLSLLLTSSSHSNMTLTSSSIQVSTALLKVCPR